MCPHFLGSENYSFFGVFDGTVGDFASDYIHPRVLPYTVNTAGFQEFLQSDTSGVPSYKSLIQAAHDGYLAADAELIEACRQQAINYSSSTGVSCLITNNVLTVAHIGDSRLAIGGYAPDQPLGSTVHGRFLTHDHKPDQMEELQRIEACGGSLIYLRGDKPFIRGGDFLQRQAMGDVPMQLNYSRAFGGKDLKNFGLSAEPDVTQIQLGSQDTVIVLGSDGLWDVCDAPTAVHVAAMALRDNKNPSDELVAYALHTHDQLGSTDNVSVIVVIINQ